MWQFQMYRVAMKEQESSNEPENVGTIKNTIGNWRIQSEFERRELNICSTDSKEKTRVLYQAVLTKKGFKGYQKAFPLHKKEERRSKHRTVFAKFNISTDSRAITKSKYLLKFKCRVLQSFTINSRTPERGHTLIQIKNQEPTSTIKTKRAWDTRDLYVRSILSLRLSKPHREKINSY